MNGSFAGLLRGKLHSWATIALALVLLLGCRPGAHAQGLINFLNNSATLITLSSNFNTVAMPGSQPGTFRFELFIAPAGTLNPANFTSTGLIATNTSSAGRFVGGNNLVVPGAPAGSTRAILVRGWSADLGSNYASAVIASHHQSGGLIGESSIAPNFVFGGFDGVGTIPTSPAFGGLYGIQSGFVLSLACLSCAPPFFVEHPSNALVAVGGGVSLRSEAWSYQHLSVGYQWWKNGSSIAGANGNWLILANVTLSDSGVYHVVASDVYGSTPSHPATLTVFFPVIAATLGSPTYTTNNQLRFTVSGTPGTNYIVQVSTNLAATANWISLFTNASPFTFVETNATSFPQRFYRAYAP